MRPTPRRPESPPERSRLGGQARSPVSERTRPGPAGGEDPERERIVVALVELAGEHGLRGATVAAVCDRAGVDRAAFDSRFRGKEDCFLRTYDWAAGELCRRARAAYDGGPRSWHDRIWAAAWEAVRFLQEDPRRARFLVVEVNGAGARAQARRDGVLHGIADLIDGGRAELKDPGSVSRTTAEMVAGAIYGTLLTKVKGGAIERGEDFLPELVYMAAMPYLGASAAEEELGVQSLR